MGFGITGVEVGEKDVGLGWVEVAVVQEDGAGVAASVLVAGCVEQVASRGGGEGDGEEAGFGGGG
ncbi:hypothetical protein JOD54_003366 [Actinokineospora baliensis]|nr:hypothetical protein [Actinokineospora baliensis]